MRKDHEARRRSGGIMLVLSLIAALSVVFAPTASAAPVSVTTITDEYDDPGPGTGCSLREAIKAVSDAGDFGGCTYDGDPDITMGAGTHALTLDAGGLQGGDLNIDTEMSITGAGANATTIQQTVAEEGVIKMDGVDLDLVGMTVTGATKYEGIKGDADLGLDGVAVVGNTAGGVKLESTMTVTNSTFSGNGDAADPKVGGAQVDDADIRNSTFSGNFAKSGGGLDVSGTAVLNNVTITANTVDGSGGSAKGGGLHTDGGSVTISNTIIAGNTNVGDNNAGPDDCFAGSGDITSGDGTDGYNLIGTGDDCNWPASVTGDQVGTDAAPIDALLNPLGAFGGTTNTHMPQLASPAIDGGNPATPADDSEPLCETTDQRGQPRPSGAACDIGAVERQPTDTDTPGGDQVGGTVFARCAKRTASLVGTSIRDVLKGTSGKDVMAGLAGRDKMSGKAKRDRMCGAGGKDTTRGGGGNDIMKGGKGNDLLVGGAGRDKCVGGPGRDRARGCEKTVKIP